MKLSAAKVKQACKRRGMLLGQALDGAGVSGTAYYSLLRNDSVLPTSLLVLADHLEISPAGMLDQAPSAALRARTLLKELEQVLTRFSGQISSFAIVTPTKVPVA